MHMHFKLEWKTGPIGEALLGFDTELKLKKKLKCSHLDVMYGREDEVEDS